MKKAVKKRWIKALRSGEYKQTKCLLHKVDGSMCCLGVLCDIELDEYWEPICKLGSDGGEESVVCYTMRGRSEMLPSEFSHKIGLLDPEAEELTTMNDVRDKSFEEIADYIEKEL